MLAQQSDIFVKLQIIFLPTASLLADTNSRSQALERLLAIGQHNRVASSAQTLLCQMMGVAKQADWPIAPFSWAGEGGEPGVDYWLCADPVHLILQRDSFSLSAPAPLAVTPQDAQVLAAKLNQHFVADGLQFQLGDSGRWYLRLETPPAITTSLPEAAIDRDISPFLPQGAGAAKWNRLLNEIQMLVFEHPVNVARESRGELAINSIWLSGGGVLTQQLNPSIKAIYADGSLAKGLAATANMPYFAVPDGLSGLLGAEGDMVLMLDDAEDAERKWFAPLLQALRSRKITELNIHLLMRDQLLQVLVKPMDCWKFWRKTKLLEAYFHG